MVNFRKFVLKSGKEVSAGRDSNNNDLLVESSKRNDVLLHTVASGSPFVNLGEKPSRDEIKEGAVFCALKSQDFRDNGGNVKVNVFKREDCFKEKGMASGTWGVKKYDDTVNVKKIDIVKLRGRVEDEKTF